MSAYLIVRTVLFVALLLASIRMVNFAGTLDDYSSFAPLSGLLVQLIGIDSWNPAVVHVGHEACFWVHVTAIMWFLSHIPLSKHLHIITAAPNVFLKPTVREKAIVKTSFEDENVTSYGMGKITDLSWKGVLDLYACTECGRCEEQCPAANTGKALSPKKLVRNAKDELFGQSSNIVGAKGTNGSVGEVPALVREGSKITDEVVWACTTCRACENICPVNIQHLDVITELRKNLVLMEARFPAELQATLQNLENQSNPWGLGQDGRAAWSKGMELKQASDGRADILYFAGCFGSCDEQGVKIAQATASCLKRAGVDFVILGEEETCCGDPARRSRNEYLAQAQITALVETLARYAPKKIVTGCPHCFNALRNEYPDFGARFEVVHHTGFLLELVKDGRLKLSWLDKKVTFHDSCYLSRWNAVVDAPRDLLQAIPGLQCTEMERNRDKCFCCGAGGAGMFLEENSGTRINQERMEEVRRTGSSTVVSACPYCNTMLTDGAKAKNMEVSVRDIAQLVELASRSSCNV